MGIDLKDKRKPVKRRRTLRSKDTYLKLLNQLYEFLARRTNEKFPATVAHRIKMARRFKQAMSLSKLYKFMQGREDQYACIVGKITNDVRMLDLPKPLKVCCINMTEAARARIVQSGGEVITFDQLAMRTPKGEGCVLLRGPTKARKEEKHFGVAPGLPGSTAQPYVRHNGRKFERGRGRRASRAYKA